MFELHIISILSENGYIKTGVSEHKGKPAIFPYYTPKEAFKPYILFYTANYDVQTKAESKLLMVDYYNDEMSFEDSKHVIDEIVKSLDGIVIENEKYGELRLYLSGNPQRTISAEQVQSITIKFILRGSLKNWGIV